MRLIDASEMVKRLEEWNTADPMDKALYNFAMSRINEQPTVQPEPKWIPCSDCERKCDKWENSKT